MAASRAPRVLVVHNRYRFEGGEERSVELQLRALERAGVVHAALTRSSAGLARGRAAVAMLRGGERPEELAGAVRELGADVVHLHNIQPLVGPRGLRAAREAGAAVALHLHNSRLFCAIGVAARDGGPCFRCHGRNTLPGIVLNCRGSLPEAAVYALALSGQQPAVLAAVDRFVVPSRYAAGQLARLGLPADRIEVLQHYLPAEAVAPRSRADRGSFALIAARLAPEKGIDTAVEAARIAGVPLRIAGDGPAMEDLSERIGRAGAPVELLGRVDPAGIRRLMGDAAVALVPSNSHEFAPYAALEAMAAGVPVIASRMGGLPELIGDERCVAHGDAQALAAALGSLWRDPERRQLEGEALRERLVRRHGEERYVNGLLELYARMRPPAAAGG